MDASDLPEVLAHLESLNAGLTILLARHAQSEDAIRRMEKILQGLLIRIESLEKS